MHSRSSFLRCFPLLLALAFAAAPVAIRAQTASPVASPVALDASMVTGAWVVRANDQRNGQVDGDPLQGAPRIIQATDLKANLFLPPAPGDSIVIAQSEFAIAAYDQKTGERYWSVTQAPTGAAPSLVDGRVYTGTPDGGYALDARTGETIWHFAPTHDPTLEIPDGAPPTTVVDASIAVANGQAYVSGGPYGGLWALDAATGAVVWTYDTMGGVPAAASYSDGAVYLATDTVGGAIGTWPDTTPGRLLALDASTGELQWEADFPEMMTSFTPPVVLDDTILVGLSPGPGAPYVGSWTAYDRTSGEIKWSVPTASPPWGANASGKDGVFFVPGAEATGVTALDAETGATVWQHDTPGMVWWGMLAVGNTLYVNTEQDGLQALDTATGALLWSLPLPALLPNPPHTGVTYSNGVLYVGAGTTLYAVDGDGQAAPAAEAPPAMTLPAVGPDADSFLQWGGTLTSPEALSGPDGVAVNPATGEIFVVDAKNDRFQIFKPDGTFDRVWGETGSDPGQFAFHEEDGFFVGDAAFATDGRLIVADPGNSRIQIFDPDLNFMREIDLPPPDDIGPYRMNGIALDEAHNRLYVTEFVHNNFLVYDLGGTLVGQWGADGADNAVPMAFPSDVTVGPDGNVYVTDTGRGKIRVFTSQGEPVAVWGGRGTRPGQFVAPISPTFDAQGNLYVTDYALNRIQVFAPDGTVIGVFGAEGTGDGQFANPAFLAVTPDGRLLVTDESNNRVVILTTPLAAPSASPVASPSA